MSQIKKDLIHNQDEFTAGVNTLSEPHSRRSFIKGLGGTMALAGIASCAPIRKPEQPIIPYAQQPEYLIEGKSVYYASSMAVGDNVTGVLVETFEGRPTKIEGNPDHQGSFGTTNMYTQASILDLYDPDRLQHIEHKGKQVDRSHFINWLNI